LRSGPAPAADLVGANAIAKLDVAEALSYRRIGHLP
jgi:hypothetical protein